MDQRNPGGVRPIVADLVSPAAEAPHQLDAAHVFRFGCDHTRHCCDVQSGAGFQDGGLEPAIFEIGNCSRVADAGGDGGGCDAVGAGSSFSSSSSSAAAAVGVGQRVAVVVVFVVVVMVVTAMIMKIIMRQKKIL